jgi:hypothetical protein
MSMMAEKLAPCGLVCDECPAYIATQTCDEELIKSTAERWSSTDCVIDPDDIVCDGCDGRGRLNRFCNMCEVRGCAMEREVEHCGLCEAYVCERLERLWRMIDSPEARERLESLRK